MKKLLLVLLFALSLSGEALAQNPTCPTRPVGDSSNACASTAFVANNTDGVVNVVGMGAVGDCVTESATAFQNAINLATTTKRAVYVPAGCYKISTGLTYHWTSGSDIPPLIMFGEGMYTSIICSNVSNGQLLSIKGGNGPGIQNFIKGSHLWDLGFSGNQCGSPVNADAIRLWSAWYNTFERVRIANFSRYGLYLFSNTGDNDSTAYTYVYQSRLDSNDRGFYATTTPGIGQAGHSAIEFFMTSLTGGSYPIHVSGTDSLKISYSGVVSGSQGCIYVNFDNLSRQRNFWIEKTEIGNGCGASSYAVDIVGVTVGVFTNNTCTFNTGELAAGCLRLGGSNTATDFTSGFSGRNNIVNVSNSIDHTGFVAFEFEGPNNVASPMTSLNVIGNTIFQNFPSPLTFGQASFTASISGTTMTVSAVASGTLTANTAVIGAAANTRIVSQLSGPAGGIGDYQVSVSQTLGSGALTSRGYGGIRFKGNIWNSNQYFVSADEQLESLLPTNSPRRMMISGGSRFTASISGTTMTVTAVAEGTILPAKAIAGTGVTANTLIVQQLTGTAGSTGTYEVDTSQVVGSTTISSGGAPTWTTLIWPTTGLQGQMFQTFPDNTVIATYSPTLGSSAQNGTLSFQNKAGGLYTIQPGSGASTPTATLGTNSGTIAVSATLPLAINATTGNITLAALACSDLSDDGPFCAGTDAANLTGLVALAQGGCNTNLTGTGGTSQVLRQSSVGANCTVSQLAASDLSNGTSGSGAVILATGATLSAPAIANISGNTTIGQSANSQVNISSSTLASTGLLISSNSSGRWTMQTVGTGTDLVFTSGAGIGVSAPGTTRLTLYNAGGATMGAPTGGSKGVGTISLADSIYTGATNFMHRTTAALANGAGAGAGTLANAPAAGNPTKWIPIDDNGTTRYIPAW